MAGRRSIESTRWRRWSGSLLDFLLPPSCAVCGREGAQLCDPCRGEFRAAGRLRCASCWTPGRDPLCAACLALPPAFETLRASFVYEGALREAVLALKFQGMRALARPLVELVDLEAVTPVGQSVEVVCAVPMSPRRRRQRGYDQAEVIGRALAQRLGLPFEGRLLGRARPTGQQSSQPDVAARRRNVHGAFRAGPPGCAGRRVLVVDDVTTSGATLAAAAQALRIGGAGRVHAWALARED